MQRLIWWKQCKRNEQEESFFAERMSENAGLVLLVPRQIVNNVYLLSAASTWVTQSSCRLQRQMCGLSRTLLNLE